MPVIAVTESSDGNTIVHKIDRLIGPDSPEFLEWLRSFDAVFQDPVYEKYALNLSRSTVE